MKYNKIAISGDLGSGKSVLAKKLKEYTGFEVISIGIIQRELAAKYGVDVLGFNKFMETHSEIDLECDEMVKNYGESNRGLILDSRLAWYFIPQSFKIHLKVKSCVAAERIFNDCVRGNEKYISIDDAFNKLQQRKESERKRYKILYNIDVENDSNYDFVIDTTDKSPDKIFEQVILFL